MAKQVTVLGLEGTALRGVRLDADGESFARGACDSWPLIAASDLPGAVVPADAGAEPGADEAAATEEIAEEDKPLARAFRAAAQKFGVREFVLSLPLSKFLVKTVRLPAEARDDLIGAAQLELDGISPFPDEVLVPGYEIVAETDKEIVAVIAALPDAASAEISEALAAAKVHVTRTDATAFGWLRALWPKICEKADVKRRLVLLDMDDGWDLVVLDEGAPSFLRGLGQQVSPSELGREVTLSLLQLGGADGVDEVVVCSRGHVEPMFLQRLEIFGPLREVLVDDAFAGTEGAARRTVEGATLDVTPEVWREALTENRFRKKMILALSIAGGIWLLIMGVLFGVDMTYDFMTDHQKGLQKDRKHQTAYKEVAALKSRVELIQRYADHAHGALEVFKTVSDALPNSETMMLSNFKYRRGESVRVMGTATEREDLRTFMDNLNGASFEDASDGEKLFAKVEQSGGENISKKGTIRFTMEGFFHTEEEDVKPTKKGSGK